MVDAWRTVLELDDTRSVIGGSERALGEAVGRGADLRIYTEFYHHEHIRPGSANRELMKEVSDFRTTYLVDGRWTAGIMTLRMPIDPPEGFGPRPSMSFFLYNQDGSQAIARPFLDGRPSTGEPGASPLDDHSDMPKYHQNDGWDADTNAPSSNFTYDFERFRYIVRDDWSEVFAHDERGAPLHGSRADLTEAFVAGAEIKVGIRGLCADLQDGEGIDGTTHEIFVHTGPGYLSTERGIFCAGSHPTVRVRPAVPLRYRSRGWDFGWLLVRTDGRVARWLCDPYSLRFEKSESRYAVRWFVR